MSAAASVEARGRRLPDPAACQRLAEQMLSLALKAGADGAEVLVRDGAELEVKVRLGEPELIKEAGSRALGLRVIKDHRAAVTYTSDFAPEAMARFARESVIVRDPPSAAPWLCSRTRSGDQSTGAPHAVAPAWPGSRDRGR